jgi:hypothetical protein
VSDNATTVRAKGAARNKGARAHRAGSKDVARSDKSANEAIPHGTAGGYTNHGCSCAECSTAWAETCMTARERRMAKGLPPGDKRHGTENGYSNWGCGCDACREAHNASKRRQRRHKAS